MNRKFKNGAVLQSKQYKQILIIVCDFFKRGNDYWYLCMNKKGEFVDGIQDIVEGNYIQVN